MSRGNSSNLTHVQASKCSSMTQEEKEDMDFKMSNMEKIIEILEYIILMKVDVLDMVSKIEFQTFKDDIKGNLKDMEIKYDIKGRTIKCKAQI
jgi:(p)ppGpp synthase/HD superfamily hydrolase